MKVLVLSGGSIRSTYQLGAVKGLIDSGYRPDVVVGISGGGLVGMLLTEKIGVQCVPLKEADYKLAAKEACDFWVSNVTSSKSIIKKKGVLKLAKDILTKNFNGLFDNEPLKELVYTHMDGLDVIDSPLTCVTGAVNFNSGEIEYKANTDLGFIGHTVAGASIPLVFPSVELNGKSYIDGGLIDSTPLKQAFEYNPTEITCVITSPEERFDSQIDEGNLGEYVSRVLDIMLANNLDNDIKEAKFINELIAYNSKIRLENGYLSKRNIPIKIIRPEKEIEVKIQDFNTIDILDMITLGYNDATK